MTRYAKIGTHAGTCRDCGGPFAYAMFSKTSPGWRVVRCRPCIDARRLARDLRGGGPR